MEQDVIVYTIFLVFTGSAIMATLALYVRQSLLLSYILLGVLFGPWGLALVTDALPLKEVAHIGIMFLLFLMGLDLDPKELISMVRRTTLVTAISSLIFALTGGGIAWLFGFSLFECLLIGAAVTFSSTILGLKLLPTTVLHHQRTGEIMISILLLQDIAAIIVLLSLQGAAGGEASGSGFILLTLSLPALIGFAWLFEHFILTRLIRKFDCIKEYIFLMAIGWCLGMAELAALLGLSSEIGAFIAGVILARGPVGVYIADSLKPLRDFFLVLFFFSLGAGFDLGMVGSVIVPAVLIAGAMLVGKPVVFEILLHRAGESKRRSREVGFRLGQMSEFSLFIAVLALDIGAIGSEASYLIQLSTLLTFLVSSYVVVMRCHTPIAVSDKLRQD